MSGRTDAHDGGRSRWTSHGSVQQSAKSPCWLCFSRWTRDIYKHAVSQKPVLQKQGGVNMQLLCSAVNCQSRMYYGHLLPVRTPGTITASIPGHSRNEPSWWRSKACKPTKQTKSSLLGKDMQRNYASVKHMTDVDFFHYLRQTGSPSFRVQLHHMSEHLPTWLWLRCIIIKAMSGSENCQYFSTKTSF